MAIQFRVRELIEARGLTQTEVQVKSGLAFSTVNALYNNKPRRIELDTLDVLCATLDCTIADILEYVPDKHRNRAIHA